jgi:histidine triad (HIT) family protein
MKRFLFSLAKTGLGGWLLGWIIANCTFLIPGEKLIETETIIAFHHPQPAYPLHILILPKANYQNLTDLPTEDRQFEYDLFQAVNQLVGKYDLTSKGYRMIVNGGKSQEVPHLHFHLISEGKMVESS